MIASADPISSTTFAPVLNVPALCSFLVVFLVFSLLQWRVSDIGRAVNARTDALQELRAAKSKELTGEASTDDVDRAVETYRRAYEKVEELRSVIPGVARLVPPSSVSMKNSDAAAKQFLGVEESSQTSNSTDDAPVQGLSGGQTAVLLIVAASQMLLLGLLTMDSMSANSVLDSLGSDIVE